MTAFYKPRRIKMKEISKYNKTVRIERIVHVVAKTDHTKVHMFEAVSGDPNTTGKTVNIPCSPELYRQILGTREGNVIKPLLRGDQRHAMLVRFSDVKLKDGESEVSVATGIDRIPQRFFQGSSGPSLLKENRINGFEMEWVEDHSGFKIDSVELGMNRRDLESLLDDIRKNMGNKRSYKTKCGRTVTFVDEITLKVKNPKPFKERQI